MGEPEHLAKLEVMHLDLYESCHRSLVSSFQFQNFENVLELFVIYFSSAITLSIVSVFLNEFSTDIIGDVTFALFLRRATSLELPMAMRFRHLERTSKEAVGVYRSATAAKQSRAPCNDCKHVVTQLGQFKNRKLEMSASCFY